MKTEDLSKSNQLPPKRNPPPKCEYQGKHFGADYEDACCIYGYLWDLDSCKYPGGPLYQGGEIPFPNCNSEEYNKYLSETGQDDQSTKTANELLMPLARLAASAEATAITPPCSPIASRKLANPSPT